MGRLSVGDGIAQCRPGPGPYSLCTARRTRELQASAAAGTIAALEPAGCRLGERTLRCAAQVAALKLEMQQQAAEAEAREAALLEELAALRGRLAAKKPSPTKALKKTLSQVRGGGRRAGGGEALGRTGAGGSTAWCCYGEARPHEVPVRSASRAPL